MYDRHNLEGVYEIANRASLQQAHRKSVVWDNFGTAYVAKSC